MTYSDCSIALEAALKGKKWYAAACTWLGDDGDYSTAMWDLKTKGKHPRKQTVSYADAISGNIDA